MYVCVCSQYVLLLVNVTMHTVCDATLAQIYRGIKLITQFISTLMLRLYFESNTYEPHRSMM